jgi:hypothetical protein
MKTFLLFLLSMVSLIDGFSQIITDKERYELRGKVESVYSKTFHATYDSLGILKKGSLYNDNQHNFLMSKFFHAFILYTPQNSLSVFDGDGSAKTILYFRKYEMVLYMAEIRSFESDSIFTEKIYVGDEVTFNYVSTISKKLMVRKRLIRTDGDETDTITVYYHYLKNRIVKEEMFHNSEIDGKISYSYDQEHRILKKYFLDKNDTALITWSYTYNKQGYIENEFESSEQRKIQRRFEYKYDSQGNWIECYRFIDNSLDAFIERKIKYFK